MLEKNKLPIGVFDSGIGGLTVVRALKEHLPHEKIIYFGDTGRVPYGNKSKSIITEYSLQITRFLEEQGVKMIVIACNTATAHAMDEIVRHTQFPVVGVIEPGARAAIKKTKSKRIGVIGTQGTINSKAYQHAIHLLDSDAHVFGQACPLFVPLVEEGWFDHPATRLIIREYLKPLENQHIDTLVLGCTHYPLLREAIEREVFGSINIVDSAEEIAMEVKNVLQENRLLNLEKTKPNNHYFVSDLNFRFKELGQTFLGEPFKHVELHEW